MGYLMGYQGDILWDVLSDRMGYIYIIQPTKTRNGCVMINGSNPKITRVVKNPGKS